MRIKNITIFYVCFAVWMILYLGSVISIFRDNLSYYKFASTASPELLREDTTNVLDYSTYDFYQILKKCQSRLSAGQMIQIVLPQNLPERFAFWREKARYILYPHNYGDNVSPQKFILVFAVDNFVIPRGYTKTIIFDRDKYLLEKITPN